MMLFMLTGAVIGALLAPRLSVLSLIPATIVALVIASATWLFGYGSTIAQVVSLLFGLQLGYLGAAGIYFARQPSAGRAVGSPIGRMPRSR